MDYTRFGVREESIYSALFKQHIRACRRRNVFWDLPFDVFEKVVKGCCDYCGTKPAQCYRKSVIYNGIDRKDNSKGYVEGNVVTCCKSCNFLKGNRLSYEEAKAAIESILKVRQQK